MESPHFNQFKAGHERALSVYFDRHVQALLLFAYRMVADEAVAEELVQDAYVKLWDARVRMESEAHLKSFLYYTTRNACVDYLRGNENRIRSMSNEPDERIAQAESDLLARMIHAETLQLVYREVKKLPPAQQRVFKLTFIDGLKTEEICAELGMTTNAVFIARSKALATLRDLFKGEELLAYVAFLSLLENSGGFALPA